MFGRFFFGRKKPSKHTDASTNEVETNFGLETSSLLFETVFKQTQDIFKRNGTNTYASMWHLVAKFSPRERTDLATSLTIYAAELRRAQFSNDRLGLIQVCLSSCIRHGLVGEARDLSAFVTLLTHFYTFKYAGSSKEIAHMVKVIRESIRDGAFLDTENRAMLARFARELRALGEEAHRKSEKRTFLDRALLIEGLAGLDISKTSILLTRCEPSEPLYIMQPLHPHYEFWCSLFAETAQCLNDLATTVRAKRKPQFNNQLAEFKRDFPNDDLTALTYGELTRSVQTIESDLGSLRSRFPKKRVLATAEDFLSMKAKRPMVQQLVDHVWNTQSIPAIERLMDVSDPKWTALLEQFIDVKTGSRPTAAWRKNTLTFVDAIGRPIVAERIQDWLSIFHTPQRTPRSLADVANCRIMDHAIAHLSQVLPDWPSQITGLKLKTAAAAIACILASGYDTTIPSPINLHLFTYDDQSFGGRSATLGELGLSNWGGTAPSRYFGPSFIQAQSVSFENDQLLRSVLWLLPNLIDAENAIAALEKVALAAAFRLSPGEGSLRSGAVANAAIATLIDMKNDLAQDALSRLSKQIEAKTVNAAIFKALAN